MYETDRLIMRHFLPDDVEKCMESWGKDTNLGRYIIGYPMMDIVQMKNFVEGMSKQKNAWVLVEKESNDIVGYVIGEKYQGNKYSYEALKYLLHIYFTEYGLYLIEAKYNASNKASEQILQRLGFKKEAVLRGRRMNFLTGERNDMVICSIDRKEMDKYPAINAR